MQTLIAAIVALLALTGCYPVEKEYEWVREDGDVFVVKWSINDKNKLTLIQKYTASPTSSAIVRIPSGTSTIDEIAYFLPCAVIDIRNWECKTSTPNESISMIDGVLTHNYWGTVRVYKIRYRLAF